jgi:hypothetical protein
VIKMYNEIGRSEEEKIQKEQDRISRLSPTELKREYLRKEGLLDEEAEAELRAELETERHMKMSDEELRAAFEAQEAQDLSRGRVDDGQMRKEAGNRIPWFS